MGVAKKKPSTTTRGKPAPPKPTREEQLRKARQLGAAAREELKRSGGKLFSEDEIEEYLGR